MSRLKKIDVVYKTTIAGGFSAASVKLDEYLDEVKLAPLLSMIIVAIIAVTALKIAELIFELLISKSEKLRQMIFGDEFTEGYWLDIVFDADTREVLFGGLILLSFDDNEMQLSGESFDYDGRYLGNFKTDTTKYSNYKLEYTYGLVSEDSDRVDDHGSGIYNFVPRKNLPPNNFTGHFFDTFHKTRRILVKGVKIENYIASEYATTEMKAKAVSNFLKKECEKQRYTIPCLQF